MGVSQESILFLFVSSGRTRGEKSSSWKVRKVEWRESWSGGGVEIWADSWISKWNISNAVCVWKMGNHCWMKPEWWATVNEGATPTYLTMFMLLFFSCSSRRVRSCSCAMAISSSMLVISSLARRRFSYDNRKHKGSKMALMCFRWQTYLSYQNKSKS